VWNLELCDRANTASNPPLSFTNTGCCMTAIKAANRTCNSISDTACMVKSATLPVTNQNPGQTPPVSCGNGSGVYNSDQTVCCDKRCGYCGGGVCHQQFPGSAPYCCQSEIIAANKQCGTAPCIKTASGSPSGTIDTPPCNAGSTECGGV
jgi:hypothetical protein